MLFGPPNDFPSPRARERYKCSDEGRSLKDRYRGHPPSPRKRRFAREISRDQWESGLPRMLHVRPHKELQELQISVMSSTPKTPEDFLESVLVMPFELIEHRVKIHCGKVDCEVVCSKLPTGKYP